MKRFRDFALQEEVRASHAARFMNYEEKHHHQLALEAARALIRAWEADVKKLNRELKPQESWEAPQLAPDGQTVLHPRLQVITHAERWTSTRWQGTMLVGPSVKVPLAFSPSQRRYAIHTLLTSAEHVLERLITDTAKILNLDAEEDLTKIFKVARDEEVKLRFVSSKQGAETSKTIFKVLVDHGRPGSKTRDHDRVFFMDNLLKA